jgi:CubicO group peptidase (beta-lactamase class C family)
MVHVVFVSCENDDLLCSMLTVCRQLLSHTSGSGYPFTPELIKYLTLKGWTPDSPNAATIVERYDFPLSFEPGTSWGYGPGIDWAGLLVERLSKLTLEEFMKKHIFQPLGITGISFWPETLGAAKERIPELVVRRADGTFGPNTKKTLNTNSTDCFGGHGAYAQLGDYLKVQRSLLANDGVLLKPASVDELFRPQLSAKPLAALNFFRKHLSTSLVGGINQDIEVSYGLGGMVFLADDVGRRRKGTLSWGGMVNPFWIIDREAGLALTVGFQVLPTGDAGVKEMTSVAERAVYKMAGLA